MGLNINRAALADNVKGLLGAVAPALATAYGGPLAGVATQTLARDLLGIEGATLEDVQGYLTTARTEDLVALKRIDAEFQASLEEAGVSLERVAAEDRASARQRQVQMGDWSPSILGGAIIVGFFGVLVALMVWSLPPAVADVIQIMLGALAALVTQVANYFFGSSRGSKNKDITIATLKASSPSVADRAAMGGVIY